MQRGILPFLSKNGIHSNRGSSVRPAAAVAEGLSGLSGLSPEQIRVYRLADNATGERAEWAFELPVELSELQAAVKRD